MVDLPAPEEPTRAVVVPSGIVKLKLERIGAVYRVG
jgi:hypothetical protein